LSIAMTIVTDRTQELETYAEDARAACDPWHVLHTRSRQEKAVERALAGQGIEVFLPTVNRTMFYGHRKRTVQTPLFSGYVFMRGDADATYAAINTRRIARIVPVIQQERFVHEITQIRLTLEATDAFFPSPYLEVGTRVRVSRGPLKDVEGVVELRRFPNRLVLQIQTLGRATGLEIDADLLEPIEE